MMVSLLLPLAYPVWHLVLGSLPTLDLPPLGLPDPLDLDLLSLGSQSPRRVPVNGEAPQNPLTAAETHVESEVYCLMPWNDVSGG